MVAITMCLNFGCNGAPRYGYNNCSILVGKFYRSSRTYLIPMYFFFRPARTLPHHCVTSRVPKVSKNTWTIWWNSVNIWWRKLRHRQTNIIWSSNRKWWTSAFGTCRSACGTSHTRRNERKVLARYEFLDQIPKKLKTNITMNTICL